MWVNFIRHSEKHEKSVSKNANWYWHEIGLRMKKAALWIIKNQIWFAVVDYIQLFLPKSMQCLSYRRINCMYVIYCYSVYRLFIYEQIAFYRNKMIFLLYHLHRFLYILFSFSNLIFFRVPAICIIHLFSFLKRKINEIKFKYFLCLEITFV